MKVKRVTLVYKNQNGQTTKRTHIIGNIALPPKPPMGFILDSIEVNEEDITA